MNKRIIGLDILRDIGVIFIFCYHFAVEYIVTAEGTATAMMTLNYFFNVMARPASLFLFVISGYALMYNHEDDLTIGKFYLRRFKGLFIPFYVAYTLMFLVSFFVENSAVGGTAPAYRFIFTILGIDGVVQMKWTDFYLIGEWFMSCIVICYALFPLLTKLLKKYKYQTLAVLLIWYVCILFFFNPFGISPLMNPLLIVVYFYMGMLMEQTLKGVVLSRAFRGFCMAFSLAVWVYYLLAGYAPQIMPFKIATEPGEVLNILWSLAMILALRDVYISPSGISYRVITYISGISWYVILLHHRIMILFYEKRPVDTYSYRDFIALFILFVALTWIAAEAVRLISDKIKKSLCK